MTQSESRVALVTGAGTGVGKAVSLCLLSHGYRVVFAGIYREPLEQALEEAGPNAGKALAIQVDVSDSQLVAALFEQTQKRFGRLDVLFDNAGIVESPGNLEDLSVDQWRRVMVVNAMGSSAS